MNVTELSKMIGQIAKGIRLVHSYYDDDLKEVWNTKEVKYGSVVWNVSSVSLEDNIWVYNGYLYYGDRLNEAGTNINSIFSDATTVIQTIISVIYNNVDLVSEIEDYPAINYFKNKYADELAGCYVSLNIKVANEYSSCDDGYDVRTLQIKENGLYNVTGYDMADVEVQSRAAFNVVPGENITITENGEDKIISAVNMRYDDTDIQSRVDLAQEKANDAYALGQAVEQTAGQALGTANNAWALAVSTEPTANNALGKANDAMGRANDAYSYAESINTNLTNKETAIYNKISDVQTAITNRDDEMESMINYLKEELLQIKAQIGLFPQWMRQVSQETGIPVTNLKQAEDNYTFVDYIESTGTQYIDTGVRFKEPYLFTAKMQVTGNSGGYDGAFGSRNTTGDTAKSPFVFAYTNNRLRLNFVTGTSDLFKSFSSVHTIKCKRNYLSIDGVEETYSASSINAQNYSFYLFNVNNAGNPLANGMIGKVYYATITDAGAGNRYLIPCLNSSNTPIMLDLMTMTEFENAGTGSFNAEGGSKTLEEKFNEML